MPPFNPSRVIQSHTYKTVTVINNACHMYAHTHIIKLETLFRGSLGKKAGLPIKLSSFGDDTHDSISFQKNESLLARCFDQKIRYGAKTHANKLPLQFFLIFSFFLCFSSSSPFSLYSPSLFLSPLSFSHTYRELNQRRMTMQTDVKGIGKSIKKRETACFHLMYCQILKRF